MARNDTVRRRWRNRALGRNSAGNDMTLAQKKRMLWRDLAIGPLSNASPAAWMSDDLLEQYAPSSITTGQIKDAVQLANAAPDLLEALKEALPAVNYLADNGSDHSGEWAKTADKIEAAIQKAEQ